MKIKTTLFLAVGTALLGSVIYYFEVIQKEQKQLQKSNSETVVNLKAEDINFFQVQLKDQTITLQKIEKNWQVFEPIQDQADLGAVTELIKSITEQKMQNIESASMVSLSEFGLDQPLATFVIKNNLGQSEKIKIGTQKNFEGQPFAQINDQTQIKILQSFWLTKAEHNVTYYRQKKLYRGELSEISKMSIKSLNDNFTILKDGQNWISAQNSFLTLDQNKVRKLIKDFSEATIQDYIFEGDPSAKIIVEKGLQNAPVQIQFETPNTKWTASINLSESDKTVFALTTKPTYFVKLDISKWQDFANATFDSLRDRKTLLSFSISDVQKIYAKTQTSEYSFLNENQTWLLKSKLPDQNEFLPIQTEKILNQIHDLEISEFIDPKLEKKFEGQNMIILKSSSDQLVFQLNWGPLVKIKIQSLEKEVYLARTQISKNIFAIDKNKIDELNFERVYKKLEVKNTDHLPTEPQK